MGTPGLCHPPGWGGPKESWMPWMGLCWDSMVSKLFLGKGNKGMSLWLAFLDHCSAEG